MDPAFSLLVGLAVGFAVGQWVVILSLKAALRNHRPLSASDLEHQASAPLQEGCINLDEKELLL